MEKRIKTDIIALILVSITVLSGCTNFFNQKDEGKMKDIELTVSNCFNFAHNIEIDKANELCVNGELFNKYDEEWINNLFYNNLDYKIEKIKINSEIGEVFVKIQICDIVRLTQNIPELMKNDGIDNDSLSNSEFLDYINSKAESYMKSQDITIYTANTDNGWKIDVEKTKTINISR